MFWCHHDDTLDAYSCLLLVIYVYVAYCRLHGCRLGAACIAVHHSQKKHWETSVSNLGQAGLGEVYGGVGLGSQEGVGGSVKGWKWGH